MIGDVGDFSAQSIFAALSRVVGKKDAARWGDRRITVGVVGWHDGHRFVMGTLTDGTVVLGEPQDFSIR